MQRNYSRGLTSSWPVMLCLLGLLTGILILTNPTYAADPSAAQSASTAQAPTTSSSAATTGTSSNSASTSESANNQVTTDASNQPVVTTSSSSTDPSSTTENTSSQQSATTTASSTEHESASATTPAPTEKAVSTNETVSTSNNDESTVQPVNGSANSDDANSNSKSTSDQAGLNSSSSVVENTSPSVTESSDSQPTASSSSQPAQSVTVTNTTNSVTPSSAEIKVTQAASPNTDTTLATTTHTDPDQITVSGTTNSTDPAIKQSSRNPLLNWLTNLTSAGAAALIYPFITSRQGSHLVSQFRTLLSPTRYDIDHTWEDIDEKYDPAYTKQFYTDAKDWYDNRVTKQTLTVPFADGTGTASATYIAHPGSTKTIIYGQGWTTEPEWMGYIAKIFYDLGYNVLMPYTRGQNSSGGELMTFGYKDKADWINWINKINQINGTDSEVILYGQSLGADDALETAAQKNLPSSVKAVIADCGYSTIPSLLYSLYTGVANKLDSVTSKVGWHLNGSIPLIPYDQFLNNLNNINHFFQGFNLDDASGLTAVKNSTLPTLFIATEDDSFIPDSETKALYATSASTDKQLWILDGHVGGHASANNAVLAYKQHIQAFLNAVDNHQPGTSSNQVTVSDQQTVAA